MCRLHEIGKVFEKPDFDQSIRLITQVTQSYRNCKQRRGSVRFVLTKDFVAVYRQEACYGKPGGKSSLRSTQVHAQGDTKRADLSVPQPGHP